jgi:hypothetical protein
MEKCPPDPPLDFSKSLANPLKTRRLNGFHGLGG